VLKTKVFIQGLSTGSSIDKVRRVSFEDSDQKASFLSHSLLHMLTQAPDQVPQSGSTLLHQHSHSQSDPHVHSHTSSASKFNNVLHKIDSNYVEFELTELSNKYSSSKKKLRKN